MARTVTKEDISTLKNDWLTDNVSLSMHCTALDCGLTPRRSYVSGKSKALIYFALRIQSKLACHRYLEREFLPSYKNSRIILLRPSMTLMLNVTPDNQLQAMKVRLTLLSPLPVI